jgi:hypothetical protein
MKHVLVAIGVGGVVVILIPILIAAIPFILGLLGVALIWFCLARIVRRCWEIANHDVWRM